MRILIKKWLLVLSLIGLVVVMTACEEGKKRLNVDGREYDLFYTYSSYITDENYEPSEKDFLYLIMSSLSDADFRDYSSFSKRFLAEEKDDEVFFSVPMLKKYKLIDFDIEKIEKVQYEVTNRKFVSYDDETDKILVPRGIDKDGAVSWKKFEYDVFIDFSFDLKRTIHYLNGEKVSHDFHIEGEIPPTYYGSTAKWFIGWLDIAEKKSG